MCENKISIIYIGYRKRSNFTIEFANDGTIIRNKINIGSLNLKKISVFLPLISRNASKNSNHIRPNRPVVVNSFGISGSVLVERPGRGSVSIRLNEVRRHAALGDPGSLYPFCRVLLDFDFSVPATNETNYVQ